MRKNKLQRFSEIRSFPNVLQYPQNMQGQWKYFFKNENPIILELACGKGEYTVGLAQMFPGNNYIGADVKGNRLWVGAKKCLDENITNAAFLRTQIEKINNYFEAGEVSEIWITFPDPQLRTSRAKKRLTHPRFLRLYQHLLKPGAIIHLKTDSPDLYHFTRLVIEHYGLNFLAGSDNLYGTENLPPELEIRTHYEKLNIAQSSSVFYLAFSLPENMSDDDETFSLLVKSEYLHEGEQVSRNNL